MWILRGRLLRRLPDGPGSGPRGRRRAEGLASGPIRVRSEVTLRHFAAMQEEAATAATRRGQCLVRRCA
jgi:hypothetical protein